MSRSIWQNARYFADAVRKILVGGYSSCPSCGNPEAQPTDSKFMVTRLVRCRACHLLYRSPTTSEEEFRKYYQAEYRQGFTTELPDEGSLESMKRNRFVGTEKDYTGSIEILRALGCKEGDSLLDYGCSWGYGSWQFAEAGFSVTAYEVSERRRDFAEASLGVRVLRQESQIAGPYDIFFASHVLEHVPAVRKVISLARRVVRPGGWLVALTPNGSLAHRERDPGGWHKSWGFLHPLLLDDVYYRAQFGAESFLLASPPYSISDIGSWAREGRGTAILDIRGSELLLAVRLDGRLRPSVRGEVVLNARSG